MNRFTIGRKLTLGVSALALFLLVLSYTSLRAISTLGGSLDRVVNGTAKKLQLIGEAQQAFQELKSESLREQIAYAILDLERSTDGKNQQPSAGTGGCSACHSPAAVGESIHKLEALGATVGQKTGELRRLVSDEGGRKALGMIDAGVSGWLDSSKEYLALADNKRFEQAHALLRDKMFPLFEDVARATGAVSQEEREALAISDQEAGSEITWCRWAATILIGLNLLVAGFVIWLVHETIRTLRRAMTEMNTGMAQVATAAGEVSAASQALAQGASEQAAALAETSSSSEEIDSMARKNSENSRTAAELVTQSQRRFVETSQALNEMVLAMGEINTQSDKISKIIRVIDEIAFQTNMLALPN